MGKAAREIRPPQSIPNLKIEINPRPKIGRKNVRNGRIMEGKYLHLRWEGFVSNADVNPPVPVITDGATEPPENALTLAQELIRKLDEESNKKLEQVSPEEKAAEPGAA